ncbi:hypothetical protein NC651_037629 [Populus alba x Populus x berolinensis]|nr:hypothetical protein NC651_037629 [Populus alba x Populus x berolinensis]
MYSSLHGGGQIKDSILIVMRPIYLLFLPCEIIYYTQTSLLSSL